MSEVKKLIEQYTAGKMTLEELESRFTKISWPDRGMTNITSQDVFRMEQIGDVASNPPGSFYEVESAFVNGDLTIDEYRRLYAAAQKSA